MVVLSCLGNPELQRDPVQEGRVRQANTQSPEIFGHVKAEFPLSGSKGFTFKQGRITASLGIAAQGLSQCRSAGPEFIKLQFYSRRRRTVCGIQYVCRQFTHLQPAP